MVAGQLVVQFGKLAPGIRGRLPVGGFLWPALGQTLEQVSLAALPVTPLGLSSPTRRALAPWSLRRYVCSVGSAGQDVIRALSARRTHTHRAIFATMAGPRSIPSAC